MDQSYAREYRTLYYEHWWWRARERLILSTLDALKPPAGWRSILDVGCGDALLFDHLERFGSVEGLEKDPSLVSPDGRWARHIRIGALDETFQPGKKYGLILMLDVLEHFDDPPAGLRRAVELLEPDGRLLITIPAFRSLWTRHDELNHHVTRYTRGTFAAIARSARMRIDSSHYFFYWTFPLKLGIRLKEIFVRAPPRPTRIPPASLNRLMYRLSVLEQQTIARLSPPFGTSLLVTGGRL